MTEENKRDNLLINAEYELHFEKTYCIIKSLNDLSYTRIYGKIYSALQNALEAGITNEDIVCFLRQVCSNSKPEYFCSKNREIRIKKDISVDSLLCRTIKNIPSVCFSLWSICTLIGFSLSLGCYLFLTTPFQMGQTKVDVYIVSWILVNILLHEVGHLFFCVQAGRSVPEVGLKLFLFVFPMFYCKTTDICMASKTDRIKTSLAGVFNNAILCSATELMYLFITKDATIFRCFSVSFFFIVSNILPFFKLDGYYILSDLLNVSDLRHRSSSKVAEIILRKQRIRKGDVIFLAYYVIDKIFISILMLWGVYNAYCLFLYHPQ